MHVVQDLDLHDSSLHPSPSARSSGQLFRHKTLMFRPDGHFAGPICLRLGGIHLFISINAQSEGIKVTN